MKDIPMGTSSWEYILFISYFLKLNCIFNEHCPQIMVSAIPRKNVPKEGANKPFLLTIDSYRTQEVFWFAVLSTFALKFLLRIYPFIWDFLELAALK